MVKFELDIFEVRAESDDLLKSSETGEIVEVGLVIDKEVAHFV